MRRCKISSLSHQKKGKAVQQRPQEQRRRRGGGRQRDRHRAEVVGSGQVRPGRGGDHRGGRAVLTWVSEKGFRSVTPYTKLSPSNPLLKAIGNRLSSRFNTGLNLTGKFKAIFTESKMFKWLTSTKGGRIIGDMGLSAWHGVELVLKRDQLVEGVGKMVVSRTDKWLTTQVGHLSEQLATKVAKKAAKKRVSRRVASATKEMESLREFYEYLRTPLNGIQEREALVELRKRAQKIYDAFAPSERQGR